MNIEVLKEFTSFAKFFLGSFVLGGATFLVNRDIQNRQVEIEEQEQIAQYIEHAIQEDVGMRRRFAQYFSNVTRSEVLRERWREYLLVIEEEYQETKAEQEKYQTKAEAENISALEREEYLTKASNLEAKLDPTINKRETETAVSPRVYFHVTSREDKDRAQALIDILSESGYNTPGIQVLKKGPNTSEIRYFRKRERDYAIAIQSLLAGDVELKLSYVRGYESSSAIRDRHFEVWFSSDAFRPK